MPDVFYLHPKDGLDANEGTKDKPWQTMRKVKNTVGAGDVVNILGGTYTQDQIEPGAGVPAWTEQHAHGTAGKPITIQANPGDTVIFEGQSKNFWTYVEPANGDRKSVV